MNTSNLINFQSIDWDRLVKDADELLRELFPICRSLSGEGNRSTLRRLNEVVSFDMHEVESGTICYDWEVPDEWNIYQAHITDSHGKKIIDFKDNNLHIVNYSEPIDAWIPFKELDQHLHYLPDMPNAIPYRTSYYNRNWGFCLTYEQYEKLDRNETYHVTIDASISKGSLSYGERIISGSSDKQYIISTYCCHPSLAKRLSDFLCMSHSRFEFPPSLSHGL